MWFKSNKDQPASTTTLRETEDYILVMIDDSDGYYIFNRVTQNLEDQEQKLPTALFQIDALQSALTKYRESTKEA
jgi:hypothetical protein